MNRKQTFTVLMALVLVLLFCGCGRSAQTEPIDTEMPTTLPAETTAQSVGPENPDGTFTIRLKNAAVNITPPEGTESKGCSPEKVILGSDEEVYYMQYSVIEVPGDLQTSGEAMFEINNATCERAFENGILYQRMTDKVTVNDLEFDWDILDIQPEGKPSRTTVRAWAPIMEESGMSYYVELNLVLNSSGETEIQFTRDDIGPWLEAVNLLH